ncbi:MAG TPA: hypothetical protein DD640_07715 [Clostridiales bacterium]|nr:hypothetical protein [Clostridiales bacterium]
MTQTVFASVLGVSKKTIESWEAGLNHPSGASARLLQLLQDIPELSCRFYSCKVQGQ